LTVGGLQPHYIDWISGYTLMTVLQQLLVYVGYSWFPATLF